MRGSLSRQISRDGRSRVELRNAGSRQYLKMIEVGDAGERRLRING
jgi:hypothetical protein